MLRESGTVYRRNAGAAAQVAIGRPKTKYKKKREPKADRDIKMADVKDRGCSLSPSCLNCTVAALCHDCHEPLSSCDACNVLAKCPMSLNV